MNLIRVELSWTNFRFILLCCFNFNLTVRFFPPFISQVLSDPQRRKVYDQFGDEGLRSMPTPSSNGAGDFHPKHRNAEDIFAEFFGSSPFEYASMGRTKSMRFQSDGGGMFGGFGGGENGFRSCNGGGRSVGGGQRKAPAVESKLPCSLEELYTGSTRKMKISRNVLKPSG